jgi:hypothetical protein
MELNMNKQEILEQAANEYILHESKSKWAEIIKNAFIEGVKWKAEKMISLEAYEDMINMQRCSNAGFKSKIFELETQITKMYSEEEVKELCKKSRDEGYDENTLEQIGANEKIVPFDEWFEQNKQV